MYVRQRRLKSFLVLQKEDELQNMSHSKCDHKITEFLLISVMT